MINWISICSEISCHSYDQQWGSVMVVNKKNTQQRCNWQFCIHLYVFFFFYDFFSFCEMRTDKKLPFLMSCSSSSTVACSLSISGSQLCQLRVDSCEKVLLKLPRGQRSTSFLYIQMLTPLSLHFVLLLRGPQTYSHSWIGEAAVDTEWCGASLPWGFAVTPLKIFHFSYAGYFI